VLGVLPLFHIFGLRTLLLGTVTHGTELVLHLRFDAARVLADIKNKKIHYFFGVPSMFASLINHPGFKDSDFSSLHGCVSGGAPLPATLRKQFKASTDRIISERYALTETTGVGTFFPGSADPNGARVGFPAPCTVIEVVDLETGLERVPIGQIGELCFTGPTVMKGYWKRPQENADAFRGGRFHTGDLGFMDERGYITLTERKKDVILIGGHNVYPRNIERAIHEHPDVEEVAVIGVPHRLLGEIAKAFIVVKPGCEIFDYQHLCTFLAKRVGPYELPMELEFRQALPKTSVGKLAKKDLIAEEHAKRRSSGVPPAALHKEFKLS
jgi:long-chain acyl-CoA synthetase